MMGSDRIAVEPTAEGTFMRQSNWCRPLGRDRRQQVGVDPARVRTIGALGRSTLLLAVLLAGCGGGTAPTPSLEPAATPSPDATAADTPEPTPAGASLSIRATGAATACKSFQAIANCAAFIRIQPKGGTPAASDLEFTGEAATAKSLAAPADAPTSLAAGTYRITAHLDRVDTAVAFAPATPRHYTDRTCRADVTVSRKSVGVAVRVNFNDGKDCTVTVTLDPKAKATP